MQGCPLYFENKKENKLVEGFASECSPTQSPNKADYDWYERVRAMNLEQVDTTYNQYLAEYLNEYNKYLVLKGLQENADPSGSDADNFTTALQDAETNYQKKKQLLTSLAEEIEENNEYSQDLIKNQTKDIENKTRSIQNKNKLITEQTKVIDERNNIMNSRSRQIQLGVEKNIYNKAEKYALELFNAGQEWALQRGLILVDTKYEFGMYEGELIVIDEIHTPDSSRYWIEKEYQKRFEANISQLMLDKENIRQWLIEKDFSGEGTPPELTDEIRILLSETYIKLFEKLTGNKFKPAVGNVNNRINNNLLNSGII